jgi:hypothetical protein
VSNVDTSRYDAVLPTLKEKLSDKLIVNGMVENVLYVITSIQPDSPILKCDDPPVVGESISLHYDFSPYKNCYYSYEKLNLFIGRLHKKGRNYVKYFENIKSLSDAIETFEFKVDREYALRQIKRKLTEIADMKKAYGIVEQDESL